jgi:phytoene dehydrogenase-like protein
VWVVIVGAGLAGLCCARILHQAGTPCVLLEASASVGGRVRTDRVDGFLLDRGFQVLQTAYPGARRVLDYPALNLKPFYPGGPKKAKVPFEKLGIKTLEDLEEAATAHKAPLFGFGEKTEKTSFYRNSRQGHIISASRRAKPYTNTMNCEP